MNTNDFNVMCSTLRKVANQLELLASDEKEHALKSVATSLGNHADSIITANLQDVENAKIAGVAANLIDRLQVTNELIATTISSVEQIAQMPDPIGQEVTNWTLENGLNIKQIRVPLGVVAVIYESRPAVTVDCFAISFKSSNAILLRGSRTAQLTNQQLIVAIIDGLKNAKLDRDITSSVALLPTCTNFTDVEQILKARGLIDCVLPRGGKNLIDNVVQNAKIPVIETGAGVCHLFVDASADLPMALRILKNAKLSRPSACNALECLVVHEAIATPFLELVKEQLGDKIDLLLEQSEANWGVEWLSLKLSVKIVASVEEAVTFINTHNTRHSETIVTENVENANYFLKAIDAACVYHNASTRFTDGGQFGFGAELGISTQKLHIRGPMGISALTTTKYQLRGSGQIRGSD